ncbi:ABC transporter ATP-binding protein [Clostridium botulinum]|uniref:ABC transporter ATP-binding protein n=1 Tax=Clostridium botulinum TaxID=1491 RepID=A0ABC8CU51_CLOBO|nr:FtsX-like permease family protein [Clostridium botulinum]AVQ39193.1 ABC transporter ATP-binding protein [Clostridium botulinum]
MIKNYKQVTGRYLKANKKRTIITIIGIVLSVALIATIGLFFKGTQDAQVENVMRTVGSYHLMFERANEDLVNKMKNDSRVSSSGIYTASDPIKVGDKISIQEIVASDKALELLPFNAKEGRLPENEKEVAVEKWALGYIDKSAEIGKNIKINGKDYTLVGVLENSSVTQMQNAATVLMKNNNINTEKANLLVKISSKVDLQKATKELKKFRGRNKVEENNMLLMYQGAKKDYSTRGLYGAIFIVIGIVVISTIAVIYNSFQISVVERVKQFGLLRAVGTTKKQIRNMVLREATLVAIIAIPLGLLCGIIAVYSVGFVFSLIGGDSVLPTKLSISPIILLGSGAVGLFSIYASALIPANFAGKISPLVAISSRATISKEKVNRRKNKLVEKLFKFEGVLALKNIKRNRKRYRITVFSIVISVVLFISFKSLIDMSTNFRNELNESQNIHFKIYKSSEGLGDQDIKIDDLTLDNKIEDKIKDQSVVDKVYGEYRAYNFYGAIDDKLEVSDVKDIKDVYRKVNVNGQEKTVMDVSMSIYDNDALELTKNYLKSGSIDIEKLNQENGVIVINKNKVLRPELHKSYMGPLADLKVGDEISVQYKENQKVYDEKYKDNIEFGKGKVKKVKVMAIVDVSTFNLGSDVQHESEKALKVITSPDVMKKLSESKEIKPGYFNIKVKDANKDQLAMNDIEGAIKEDPSLRIINIIDENKREKSEVLMMEILVYSFIAVISLIGSVNIINTVTTNIILRKREFAALKSIGLTQKGLKKMVTLEGILYGITGAIYGSVLGCGLSYLLANQLMKSREFVWPVPWQAVVIASVSAILIGYISVLSPLSRIKKENLIEAIREEF